MGAGAEGVVYHSVERNEELLSKVNKMASSLFNDDNIASIEVEPGGWAVRIGNKMLHDLTLTEAEHLLGGFFMAMELVGSGRPDEG